MVSYQEFEKPVAGETLWCRHLPVASDDPKCLVYIAHGYGEHMGRYDEMYEFLSIKNNIYVFGHDHGWFLRPFPPSST